MIVKWGDILDSQSNYSYVAKVNICKTSGFFKYNITYPVLKLYDKYVYHDVYDRQIIININNEICEDVIKFNKISGTEDENFDVPYYVMEEIVDYIEQTAKGNSKSMKWDNVKAIIRLALINNRLSEEQADFLIKNFYREK